MPPLLSRRPTYFSSHLARTLPALLASAIISLAMTLNVAHAAASDAAPSNDMQISCHHSGFLNHIKRLHAQLNLTPEQEKIWQDAQQTTEQNRATLRTNREQMRQQFQTLKAQPMLDLNALYALRQRIEQQNAPLREQIYTAWLNVYNHLNDQQKMQVSVMLKQRFAKKEAHRRSTQEH